MVYNPHSARRERLTAFLTAKLTSEQLDAIQAAFGRGAFSQSAIPTTELYIVDKPEYHGLTHAEIRRAETNERPFLVIDEETPSDGGIWYVDQFASEEEVEDGEAQSTNVVWKIRMKLEDVPILIIEDLGNVGVDYPVPESYEQDELATSGLDYDEFITPTWVTVEPGEYEETTDEDVLKTLLPRQDKMYRLKEDIARAHGLKPGWAAAGKARPVPLPDSSTKTFPEGSIVLQVDYDPEFAWAPYQRPEGSL